MDEDRTARRIVELHGEGHHSVVIAAVLSLEVEQVAGVLEACGLVPVVVSRHWSQRVERFQSGRR